MRIDLFLYENGYARSRTEAKNLVIEGSVSVNGKVIKKPSFEIDGDGIEIKIAEQENKFASRGGLKMLCAINSFDFDIEGKYVIDIGASSGGFTDCLLQKGAAAVIALDSGSGQLVDFLRCDPRVTVIENYNARYLNPSDLPYTPSLAVMDVSFISATYIIPAIYSSIASEADFICLIKPQFEVGRANIGKGGVVRDSKARLDAVKKVTGFAENIGFKTVAVVQSDIIGGDGNIEFLAHFKKCAN